MSTLRAIAFLVCTVGAIYAIAYPFCSHAQH